MATVKINYDNENLEAELPPSATNSFTNLSDEHFDGDNSEKATRKQSACSIHDILRYVTPEEEYIFDQYDNRSIVSSELSDPFSDFDGAQFYRDQKKKRLSKLESDIFLMSTFSKGFLQAQESVRQKMMLGPNMCSEDLLNLKPNLIEEFDDSEIDEAVRKMLANIEITAPPVKRPGKNKEAKREKESRNLITRSSATNISALGAGESDYESKSQSAIWRMLDAASTHNGFPISPFGYNIYEDKSIDWLKRDDMQWNDKELCKQKCDEWLKKIVDK